MRPLLFIFFDLDERRLKVFLDFFMIYDIIKIQIERRKRNESFCPNRYRKYY